MIRLGYITLLTALSLGFTHESNSTRFTVVKVDTQKYKYADGLYELSETYKQNYKYSEPISLNIIDSLPAISFSEVKTLKKKNLRRKPPCLEIKLNKEASVKFKELTRQNIGLPLPIVFQDQIVSAPIVQMVIETGDIMVTGIDEKLIDKIIGSYK